MNESAVKQDNDVLLKIGLNKLKNRIEILPDDERTLVLSNLQNQKMKSTFNTYVETPDESPHYLGTTILQKPKADMAPLKQVDSF